VAVGGPHGQRLLILRALGLGDLLTAVPALRALASAYPEHERVLAAPRVLAPLAERIDSGLRVEPSGELEPLPASVDGAAIAVNLHGRGPQSHRLLRDAGAREFVWFQHAEIPESHGAPEWRPREHEVRRWCRLLNESGIPADPADLDMEAPPGEPPAAARGATLIHPGAASAARRWPAERFAAVATHERSRGRSVAITGSASELPLARLIAERAGLGSDSVLAGRTAVVDLMRAVAAAAHVICGDTGVAHLATALRTPSIVLFGPTSPAEWGPPTERPWNRAIWKGAAGDPHAGSVDPGLLEVGVSDVLDALEATEVRQPPRTRGAARPHATARAPRPARRR
jgi:ADP-heptose:LPS heptosyltransferase